MTSYREEACPTGTENKLWPCLHESRLTPPNAFIHEFCLRTGQTPSTVPESKLHVNQQE